MYIPVLLSIISLLLSICSLILYKMVNIIKNSKFWILNIKPIYVHVRGEYV